GPVRAADLDRAVRARVGGAVDGLATVRRLDRQRDGLAVAVHGDPAVARDGDDVARHPANLHRAVARASRRVARDVRDDEAAVAGLAGDGAVHVLDPDRAVGAPGVDV